MSESGHNALEVYEAWGGPPHRDLAAEEWLLERAAAGRPGLALYSWPEPVVVLGYAQPAADVDLEWCDASGVPVLRRVTGGTGVVHRRDLAVSLALPLDHPWARGIHPLYDAFLAALSGALAECGAAVSRRRRPEPARGRRERSPICFEDQLADTLLVDGRKAVGCAQARRARAVLVHAAVLLGLDAGLYARIFRVDAERVARGLAAAVPGGEPKVVGHRVVVALAAALELAPESCGEPQPPAALEARYDEPRWAPLAASGGEIRQRNNRPDGPVGAIGTTRPEGDPNAAKARV